MSMIKLTTALYRHIFIHIFISTKISPKKTLYFIIQNKQADQSIKELKNNFDFRGVNMSQS